MTGMIPRQIATSPHTVNQRRMIKDRNGNEISIDGHDDQTIIIYVDSDSKGHSCSHSMPFELVAAEGIAHLILARIQAAHDWAEDDQREGAA